MASEIGTRTLVRGPTRVRRFHLRVIAGPDAAKAYTSTGPQAVVGTSEQADFPLCDPTVSRFHCEILILDGQPWVRDLGSKNGTLIGGVWVKEGRLPEQASLVLGQTQVQFDIGAEDVEVELAGHDRFGLLVGQSPAMRAVFVKLERAAASEATVMLEGETGTGKELAAESIHRESARRDGPMVVVDCGAIPPDLLESELFGHEAGAFTGADKRRVGAFEAASGGTLFLDEIGELPLRLQPKLLRAIDHRRCKRIGGSVYVPCDVRIIGATNRNLRTEVNAHRFRSDLYYRLAVLPIRLPPLRDRPEDLPLLLEQILESLGAASDPRAAPVRAGPFLADLARHLWPGNVRELRNYVQRCLAMRAPEPIEQGASALPRMYESARDEWEKQYALELLRRNGNNVSAAAREAGIERLRLYRILWRHRIR